MDEFEDIDSLLDFEEGLFEEGNGAFDQLQLFKFYGDSALVLPTHLFLQVQRREM